MNYKERFVSLIGFTLILKSLSLSLKYNNLKKPQPEHFPQVERNQLDSCKARILGSSVLQQKLAREQLYLLASALSSTEISRVTKKKEQWHGALPLPYLDLGWGWWCSLEHLDGRHIIMLSKCARVSEEQLLGTEVFEWGTVKNNNRVPTGPVQVRQFWFF